MEIIKKNQDTSAFNEVQKLVSEYKEIKAKVFESYEKTSRTIFILIWLTVCFLFIPLTFVGACMLFTLLLLYFLIPGVAETKKIERAGFFFWKESFKKKVFYERTDITIRLLRRGTSVRRMMYDDKWASIAMEAKKIMGV
ncbi:MAG: hypothetical protein WC241_04835 [Candidatus Paceibacterota bacterium]|jgi:hypothetical protein